MVYFATEYTDFKLQNQLSETCHYLDTMLTYGSLFYLKMTQIEQAMVAAEKIQNPDFNFNVDVLLI